MLSGKRHRDLTASHEHYLRALFKVRSERGYEARGLIAHDDHRFLVLTPEGEHVARAVHHRFAVIHAFLRDLLGMPESVALDEAAGSSTSSATPPPTGWWIRSR